jgi:uncharacterized surface anchored protein
MPVQKTPQARVSAAQIYGRRVRRTLLAALVLLVTPMCVSQANAALSLANPPAFTFVNDENGADDQPGQKDLSAHSVASPAPGDLWVSWKWDVTSLSGGNTGDGCALFDTDSDSKVNFAICVTIQGNPAVQAPASPRVYTCGDGKVDRCTSTYVQVTPINSACGTNISASDPFHSGQNDTQAICHIDLADVGGAGTTNLVNTCSYPSQQPTSAPSDCVLIPRDAFLKITKVASPNSGSFPFRLGLTTETTPAVVFTAAGSQSSSFIAIRSDVKYKLKEDVPTNWAISGTPSCTGTSGTGSSNGTFSVDTITNIDASPDNEITCTFNDVQQTGAIEITKQRSGTTIKLAGAHFTIDGSGDYVTDANGKVCVAGLSIGSHTVTETTAPDGHDLASPASQSVSVTGAGTCAAGGGAATVTFNDPVVKGTINIHKTDGNDAPLAGATFTLYVNNAPLAAPRGAEDTITAKTCTTGATGDCSILNVDLGDYWVVETGVPNGYIAAADRAVNVGVGPSPGTGDTDSLTFVDPAAPGRINIHKTGFGGAALAGATFTLWIDNQPVGGDTVGHHGLEDTATAKTCTTNVAGDCSILDVPPGNYWLVESTTPAGYDTADDTSVTVPLGSQAGQGATVGVNISDPVVPGTIDIHKTGINGTALEGATFTLYVNNAPLAGPRGAEDTITTKTCTTNAAGNCSIGSVTPGNYWVVETTTPAGYDTAPEQAVNVGIGTAAHVGDSDSLEFADPVVNGKVSITKTDDVDNALAGAEFTLYVNNAPLAGPRGAEDTITTKKCTTDAAGKCDIANVVPGKYWVVETQTPTGYDTAADQAITVGLGSAAHQGDTVPVSFVDERQHRVVVLVCHEGTDTLFSRDVTVGTETKQSLAPGALSGAQQKALCDTGGASFGNISGHGSVTAEVDLGPAH